MLVIRRQTSGFGRQHVRDFEHGRNLGHAFFHLGLWHAAIAQWEGKVIKDSHRVVDHRKLENLRDVALVWRQGGDVFAIEQDLPFGGVQQPRYDVEQRGFPAA